MDTFVETVKLSDIRQPPNIKCVLLVGGFGTRLRPLTLTRPKPLIPFCNLSMIEHQILKLKEADIHHIVLAINYQPDVMMQEMDSIAEKYGVTIDYSVEDEPLDTGGPLKLAERFIGDAETFCCFNSDILCDYNLKDMIKQHLYAAQNCGVQATIGVTRVDDPRRFGVILGEELVATSRRSTSTCTSTFDGSDADSNAPEEHHHSEVSDTSESLSRVILVRSFIEKPEIPPSDTINAGLYVFQRTVLDSIPLQRISLERSIFPGLAAENALQMYHLNGDWADVGQPPDFVSSTPKFIKMMSNMSQIGHFLPLNAQFGLSKGYSVHQDAQIHPSAVLTAPVVLGHGVVIEKGVKLQNCTIMPGTRICSGVEVEGSIIGFNCVIGKGKNENENSPSNSAINCRKGHECAIKLKVENCVVGDNNVIDHDISDVRI